MSLQLVLLIHFLLIPVNQNFVGFLNLFQLLPLTLEVVLIFRALDLSDVLDETQDRKLLGGSVERCQVLVEGLSQLAILIWRHLLGR